MSDDATRTGSSRPPDDSWRTRFERAGLNASLASQWESRIARLDAQGALVSNVDAAWDAFLEAPDPSLAIHTWLDWLDRIEDDGSVAEAGERWADPAFRSGFIVLAGTSEALGGYLLRWWRDFDPSAWREAGWVTARELASRLEKLIPIRDENEFLDRLRIFRKIEYLRIAWLDCVQRLPVDRVTRQISMLADELVRAAYERALLDTARRFGVEPPRRGFAILALGKLGGFELNYSSDIDLNFLWDASIDEIPRTSGGAIRGRFEVEAFFSRLAERLVSYISRFTSEGQLYRLDTRLRPEGNTARLVWSSRASLDYYYSVGRNWERQALIRLRHVAGDRELSQSFREELEPFIFPATLSIEGIQEMRRLKLQVEKIAADRSDERTEIKIGEGGIRDVEYIVQYLQLVHGAERKRLRVANVFEVLERLEAEGILTSLQTDVLRRGYRFLRRVEHHLQLDQMLQTHRLPDDPVAFRRLARGVGCPSEQAFRIELAKHATSIRRVYRLLFEQATTEHRIEDELPALLELPAESVSADDTAILAPLGFQDTKKAFDRLQSLARRSRIGGAGATMQAFQKLLFKLLRALSAQPQPDVALANFDECVGILGAPSVFYHLLSESEETLGIFVDLSSRSQLFIDTLRCRPDIFDELVDCLLTGYTFDRESLFAQVDAIRDRGGDLLREAFFIKHLHRLLTLVRDLEGGERLRVTLRRYSDTAEAILRAVLLAVGAEHEARFGRFAAAAPPFVVLGLGKLGGREMSLRSDVDLVFLYDAGDEPVTDRGIGVREWYERLAQSVLDRCRTSDALGPLIEIDARLRPLGAQNTLAVSYDAFRAHFLESKAETWERQAFMRARLVAGDVELGARVIEFIRRALVLGGEAGPPNADAIRRDVAEMRRKLEENAPRGDLKRGPGGIMDIEFLVQCLQLIHGGEHPEILDPNTAVSLERMQATGILPAGEALELLASYRFLRWIENRTAIVTDASVPLESMDPAEIEMIIAKIGYRSSGEVQASRIFLEELDYHLGRNRRALDRVLRAEDESAR